MDSIDKHFEYMDELKREEKEEKVEGEEEGEGEGKTGEEMIKCCKKKENVQIDQGMVICKVCLSTISNITNSPEWRYYGIGDNKSMDPTRCGMPVNTLLPESSVGSTISFTKNTKTMNQIRKYQQWNGMPYKERSLYKVFLEIQEICKKNNILGIIITDAKSLYSIVSKTKISRGSNRSGIIAACVYFACKESGAPRSSKEIAEMFSITSPVMTKGVKKCQEIIHMNKKNQKRLTKTESIRPGDFIERFCNKLNMDTRFTQEIIDICKVTISENIISENTPPSIAAGCIFYFIKKNKINITKKEISEISKISEVTINKCTKKLEKNVQLFN